MPTPREPPKLKTGYVHADDLAALADLAADRFDGTRAELAKALGRSSAEVSNATGASPRPQIALRREIIEQTTPYTLTGPYYRLEKRGD